jgi:hypothetical protein
MVTVSFSPQNYMDITTLIDEEGAEIDQKDEKELLDQVNTLILDLSLSISQPIGVSNNITTANIVSNRHKSLIKASGNKFIF